MSAARKRLDWAAQQELSIDPQKFARVRNARRSSSEACSMCGEFCAMRVVGEFLGTREKTDAGTC
jgi:phosphomethylpyrimidine synthase